MGLHRQAAIAGKSGLNIPFAAAAKMQIPGEIRVVHGAIFPEIPSADTPRSVHLGLHASETRIVVRPIDQEEQRRWKMFSLDRGKPIGPKGGFVRTHLKKRGGQIPAQ
jgi:hypothetical protein